MNRTTLACCRPAAPGGRAMTQLGYGSPIRSIRTIQVQVDLLFWRPSGKRVVRLLLIIVCAELYILVSGGLKCFFSKTIRGEIKRRLAIVVLQVQGSAIFEQIRDGLAVFC